MKNLTKGDVDAMSSSQLEQMIMCTNDGQGDTSVDSVGEIRDGYVDANGNCLDSGNPISNSEIVDRLWSDTNGNMTTFIWIENNRHEKIRFDF